MLLGVCSCGEKWNGSIFGAHSPLRSPLVFHHRRLSDFTLAAHVWIIARSKSLALSRLSPYNSAPDLNRRSPLLFSTNRNINVKMKAAIGRLALLLLALACLAFAHNRAPASAVGVNETHANEVRQLVDEPIDIPKYFEGARVRGCKILSLIPKMDKYAAQEYKPGSTTMESEFKTYDSEQALARNNH